MNESKKTEEKLSYLNFVILILSIYVLISLFIDIFFKLPTEVSKIISMVDTTICFIFLYDFVVRFAKAENKLNFMKWGWIDLISSIPTFDYLRAGRALRLVRLIRILRAFRSTKHLVHHIFRKRAQGAFSAAVLIAILMIIFSSIAIIQVEDDPNSNIKNAEDALWWSFVTITTVGYGDKFPVTTEGRIVGMVLMTVGVGLFGTFTGFIASWFLNSSRATNEQ